MPEPELTEAEEFALIERDPLAALCYFLKRAGATMTLYGVPVSEKELRGHAEASADDRMDLAICKNIKDEMTDKEKLQLLIEKIETIVPYVTATLPYESQAVKKHNITTSDKEWVAIHGGRAVSSTRQLESLLKLAKEMK